MRPAEFSFVCIAVAGLPSCQSLGPEAPQADRATATVQPAPQTAVPPPPASAPNPGPGTFVYSGELEQGGWLRGEVPAGTQTAHFGDTELTIDGDGRFFAGIDRDAGRITTLVAELANGTRLSTSLAVAPRDWEIERVDVALRPSGMSERFWKIREPELKRINEARGRESVSAGWAQDFVWPVRGRVSGRFGAQRIYRGEPGSYHSGLDIAPGAGTPFVAPADGVVTLAAREPFSLEGHLIIVDHGQGLNSAFLHAASIAVEDGERVRQGQQLGTVGASGRTTGPHLHWSLKWRDARLDPLLFVDR